MKASKISFKTYFNKNLKKVYFGGKLTHPLYIHITYARQNIYLKSIMFELYAQAEQLEIATPSPAVVMDFIMERESQLLAYVVEKIRNIFSMELFKQNYKYYGTNLLALAEDDTRNALIIFFNEKALPHLGKALTEKSDEYPLFEIINEAKIIFQDTIYNQMISSLTTASPYLTLYSDLNENERWPYNVLTVMDWLANDIDKKQNMDTKILKGLVTKRLKEKIENILLRLNDKYFPNNDPSTIIRY